MRKNTSFAIATITFACATDFCAWSSVVTTSPLRPHAAMQYGAAVGSFLPVKSIEPAW